MPYDKMILLMNNISQEIKDKCGLKSDIMNGQYMLLFSICLFAEEEHENITAEQMTKIYDIITSHKREIQSAIKEATKELIKDD